MRKKDILINNESYFLTMYSVFSFFFTSSLLFSSLLFSSLLYGVTPYILTRCPTNIEHVFGKITKNEKPLVLPELFFQITSLRQSQARENYKKWQESCIMSYQNDTPEFFLTIAYLSSWNESIALQSKKNYFGTKIQALCQRKDIKSNEFTVKEYIYYMVCMTIESCQNMGLPWYDPGEGIQFVVEDASLNKPH